MQKQVHVVMHVIETAAVGERPTKGMTDRR